MEQGRGRGRQWGEGTRTLMGADLGGHEGPHLLEKQGHISPLPLTPALLLRSSVTMDKVLNLTMYFLPHLKN